MTPAASSSCHTLHLPYIVTILPSMAGAPVLSVSKLSAALIGLLAVCAEGRNGKAAAVCQTLVPLAVLADALAAAL